MPVVYEGSSANEINFADVYYANVTDNYFEFTTIAAVNVQNATEDPGHITLLVGSSSSLYASANNMYLTFRNGTDTLIYRIRTDKNTLTIKAQGSVPGTPLNPYSMDEYNGYFRIATTSWFNGTATNNLYIMDWDLVITGKIENLAPGESINAARFIDDRCYLTISVIRRDPFYVVDVSDPFNPTVLGYLKVPGFTSYLHPYDANHLIGIGRDANNNVKVSLYDVTDVSNPIELATYTINGEWTSSEALFDPHAFLFNNDTGLLAIPMETFNFTDGTSGNGAYVFNVTLNGITLKGVVSQDPTNYNYTYYPQPATPYTIIEPVQRILYINNVLYTVSNTQIKLSDLNTLQKLATLQLPSNWYREIMPLP
jgi:inhibitor of cysteine peptidase